MSVIEGSLLAGKYRVERVLARGGMGVVCAAIHTQLDQRVALKFLLPEGESNEHSRLRFLREARAAVRLRSEHVARVLDVGTADEGAPYIVMEYLEGQDLAEIIVERGRIPEAEAVAYVLQAAEAVAEAHALGIIHRDLKPANLFLTVRPDGSPCVKVLDFGISKALEAGTGGGLTQATAMVGTPHYMSPEQIRSSKNVDARSDIWAMGMILYELVTGVVAFSRETLPELCSAIILDPIPSPRAVVPELSEALERAITITLAKSPDDRPQSLAELAMLLAPFTPDGREAAERIARVLKVELPATPPQRLVTLVSGDHLVAARSLDPALVEEEVREIAQADTVAPKPLPPEEASPSPSPSPPPPPLPPRELSKAPEPRSRLPIAIGVALVLGIAAATFVVLGRSPDSPEPEPSTPTAAAAPTPPEETPDPAPVASPAPEPAVAAEPSPSASAEPPSSSAAPPPPSAIASSSPPATRRGPTPKPPPKPASPAIDDFGARQ